MPHLIVLSIIFIIWAFTRFFRLNNLPFWIDEAHTYNVVTKSFLDYWNYVIADRGTMPLGYLIYQFENWIEPHHLLYRLPSILASLFICILVYHLAKEFYDKKTATIALFLSVIHPNLLFHAREARAYSFFALFFLVWLFLLYRQDKRSSYDNKKFYYYALLVNSFFIVFIHPYGFLVYVFLLLFAVNINSLKWKNLKIFFVPLILGVLMMSYLIAHPSSGTAQYDLATFLKYSLLALAGINPDILLPIFSDKINLAVSLAVLILLLSVGYKGKRFVVAVLAVFFLIFPFLHSYLNIVFVQRYLVVFIPLLIIQTSYCLTRLFFHLRIFAFATLTAVCSFNAIDVMLIEKSFLRPFGKHELSQFASRPNAPVMVSIAHQSLLKMYGVSNKVFTLYPESFNEDEVRWVKNIRGKSFSLYGQCKKLERGLKSHPYFFDAYFLFSYLAPSMCPGISDNAEKITQIDKTNNIDRFIFYKPITLYKNLNPHLDSNK